MTDYTSWTAPMRRYEIKSRIEPVARYVIDSMPYDTVVDTREILSRTDLEGFSDEDILLSLNSVLDGMCTSDGSLTRTEDGYTKKGAEEIAEIMDVLTVQYRKDNLEWYGSCVLMGILTILWAISHIWGAQLGMREFPMTLFGIPMTMYDTFLLDGLILMAAYHVFNRMTAIRQ